MRVVVITCLKYKDTWTPFLKLYEMFLGGSITLLTDRTDGRKFPWWVDVAEIPGTWCQTLAAFAKTAKEPILLFQDDFFLTQRVRHDMLIHGEEELKFRNAGCVRLYPCPGADQEYGDPYFGVVSRESDYRISCQVAWWKPEYLATIAEYAQDRIGHFELLGTRKSRQLPEPVLAFKRDVQPWPMDYLCSAITRGRWNPAAKRLCDALGIQADFTQRPMLA